MKSCKTLVLNTEIRSHTKKTGAKDFTLYGNKGDRVTMIAERGDQVAVDNKGKQFWTLKINVDEKGYKI